MVTDLDYAGPKTGEGVFMGGHSLGITCTDNLIRGYSFNYQAAILMGSNKADQKVADNEFPALT